MNDILAIVGVKISFHILVCACQEMHDFIFWLLVRTKEVYTNSNVYVLDEEMLESERLYISLRQMENTHITSHLKSK